ncbi:hypothetical protein FB446DRAFT_782579 [Lentinula raphanica]|nr:hypothetical protein FB446DRAFT_782579 [Lentinula raphanica]
MRLRTTLLPLIALAVRVAVAGNAGSGSMNLQRNNKRSGENDSDDSDDIPLIDLPGKERSRASSSHGLPPTDLFTAKALPHPNDDEIDLAEAGSAIPLLEVPQECGVDVEAWLRQINAPPGTRLAFERVGDRNSVRNRNSVRKVLKENAWTILGVVCLFGIVLMAVIYVTVGCETVRWVDDEGVEWTLLVCGDNRPGHGSSHSRRSIDWDERRRNKVGIIEPRTILKSFGGGNEQCPLSIPSSSACASKLALMNGPKKEHGKRDIGRMNYRRRLDLD